MNKDIYGLLERWGAWAASDHSGVDWKPIAAGFKGLIPYCSKSRPQTTDEEGILVDSCIAKLRHHREKEYDLIIIHFVIGLSLRAIAKRRKCSDGTIRKELQSALGFVEGYLCFTSKN